MGRIERGYEAKFRALFRRINASKPEQRVGRLLARAKRLEMAKGISHSQALARVGNRLQAQVQRWKKRRERHAHSAAVADDSSPVPQFLCDAGLGGLARWLRAAGYEASWIPDIGDDELLRKTRRLGATLVTTDSLLMERRIVRDGAIPAVWVPPSLRMVEQLAMVLAELHLPIRPARCMECGGELEAGDKLALRERIPPRTYRWLDDYYLCRRCGKLFWHGTHWEKIRAQLEGIQK